MTQSFRPKRSYLWLSIASLAVFVPLWGVFIGLFVHAMLQGRLSLLLAAGAPSRRSACLGQTWSRPDGGVPISVSRFARRGIA